jgi:type VI protein secretion system component Hcp
MATGNKPTFVIGKAIDSTSPQFQQAYLQKTPIAHVVITFQRSSDNFTVTLANATVTNDIQTSGGSGSSEQVTLSTDRLIFENASP